MFSSGVFLETPALLIRMSTWKVEVDELVKWDLDAATGTMLVTLSKHGSEGRSFEILFMRKVQQK